MTVLGRNLRWCTASVASLTAVSGVVLLVYRCWVVHARTRSRPRQQHHNVIIVDPRSFEEKKRRFLRDGPEKILVIADFDYTLTGWLQQDGTQAINTHGTFAYTDKLPQHYRQRALQLYNHYYPFEIDYTLGVEEKHEKMQEWWSHAHEALLEHRVHRTLLQELVHPSSTVGRQMVLRNGTEALIKLLHDLQIPMLVLSAGISDVIEEFLRQRDLLFPNCQVLSNKMLFDENDYHFGFAEPMLHSSNKKVLCQRAAGSFADHRPNFLVLGDHLHDAEVSDGIPHAEVYLKVGLLNHQVEQRLEEFKNAFDVVIISDGPLDFVNELLGDIVSAC